MKFWLWALWPWALAACETRANVTSFGLMLFPDLQTQDIAGPIDPLQLLARILPLRLYTIAAEVGPVASQPHAASVNTQNSSFSVSMAATHTFANAPVLDVLIVPGGPGVNYLNTSAMEAFIRERYPQLQYLITICTGAGLAAKAGVLDGKRATTNKAAWARTTALGPAVRWVSPARWVVDGKVWTSSGVTSGIDLVFAFMEEVYGTAYVTRISHVVEYERHARCWDPFAAYYNVTTDEVC